MSSKATQAVKRLSLTTLIGSERERQSDILKEGPACSSRQGTLGVFAVAFDNKKAVLSQGNRAMPRLFFSV